MSHEFAPGASSTCQTTGSSPVAVSPNRTVLGVPEHAEGGGGPGDAESTGFGCSRSVIVHLPGATRTPITPGVAVGPWNRCGRFEVIVARDLTAGGLPLVDDLDVLARGR